MLDHLDPAGGGDEGCAGGDVDGVGAIATGSRGIHEALAGNREGAAGVEEGAGGAGYIGEGLAARTDVGKEGGDMDVVILPHRQRGEDLDCFLEGRFGDIEEFLQCLEGVVIGHYLAPSMVGREESCSMQRSIMMGPVGVSTDSGWN